MFDSQSQIYVSSIVQLNYRTFSKSQLEAERLRNMIDDYKITVEQMANRYTHLNTHRLVAAQAALASVPTEYTRLLPILHSAQRQSEGLLNELMDARYNVHSYSVENKFLRNNIPIRKQKAFELKQHNSILV